MAFVYWVIIHTGCIISAHETRHEAVGAAARYHDCNDYHIESVNVLSTLYETPKVNRNEVYP